MLWTCLLYTSIEKRQVLVASTGVIGAQLPMDKITKGIQLLAPTLDESLDGGHLAAEAIMTTDTIPDVYKRQIQACSFS